MRLHPRRAALSLFPWLALALAMPAATRGDPVPGQPPPPGKPPPPRPRELVVFAAASLREIFAEMGTLFERAHPGTRVRFNLAGSQELRTQIDQGARADVFASADVEHMAALDRQKLTEPSSVFAGNVPVLVVARDNPLGVRSLHDLPRVERLVVGAPEVPIGGYTVRVLDAATRKWGAAWRARLDAAIVSRELNVRQVLAKVTLGEADAGIVYRTDARSAGGKVQAIELPADLTPTAQYPIAVVKGASDPKLAREFVRLVSSPDGQKLLAAAGFIAADRAR